MQVPGTCPLNQARSLPLRFPTEPPLHSTALELGAIATLHLPLLSPRLLLLLDGLLPFYEQRVLAHPKHGTVLIPGGGYES